MATKQFQNAKLKVDHLDLSSDTARSALQSGENISHSLGKIARWYKDIVWSDTKATIDAYGIVKLSDDYKSTSTDTVPTSKTLNDVVQLIKQTGGWNTTYDFNSNIDGDENLQNGQFKVTEHDIEGDIDHYVTIKGLGSAAFTDSDEYATAGHTHLYAGSSTAGGVANSAAKLSDVPAGGIGSETKPVYFSGTTGRPVACTYSLNASVPSGAIFTDEKVKQSPVTTDGSFEVLFAGSTGNTEKTEGVGKTTTLVFNPSKGALTATSFSGSGSGITSLNASNISSGTLAVARLADSGVVAGTYGPVANASLAHADTFDVPDFTVDAKGRVTGAHTRTFTLPAQYVHPTSAGNKHIPSGGASGQFLKWESSGTAVWSALPTASTTTAGIVQLNDTVSSTSTALAATANAVKTAYDKANHSHPYVLKAGDTMTGVLISPGIKIQKTWYGIHNAITIGTPKETVIYTKIKWVSGNHMPVVHITGYAYNNTDPIDIRIGMYIYDDKLTKCGASNAGTWFPDIYLFKHTSNSVDYVAIGLVGTCYFLMINCDVEDERNGFENISSNWSTSFYTDTGHVPSADDGVSCIKVSYNKLYAGSSSPGGAANAAIELLAISSRSAVPVTTLSAGHLKTFYNVNNGLSGNMPATNNANFIIQFNKHSGDYDSQLGFSSNGKIYYRNCNNDVLSSIAWEQLLFKSHISTGTLNGAILVDGTNVQVKGISHVAGNSTGNGIVIGYDGLTVVGAGESANALVTDAKLTGDSEVLYLTSDEGIAFYVNCQAIGNRKGMSLNAALSLYPNTTETGSVGTSSNKWDTMYANTFHGYLNGCAKDVTVTVTPGTTTHTLYGITFAADPTTTETNAIRKNGTLTYELKNGSTTVDGYSEISLGNAISKGAANNQRGWIRLYGAQNWNLQITTANTMTDNRTILFPDASGTVSLSDDKVAQTATTTNANYEVLFSGTANNTTRTEGARKAVGLLFNPSTVRLQLKGATSATAIYGSTNPAIKFSNSDASQIIELVYTNYDSWIANASLNLVGNQGNEWFTAPNISCFDPTNKTHLIQLKSYTIGTTSTVGWGQIRVGNSIASGTAGNARGGIVLYDLTAYYVNLVTTDNLTANRTIKFPNASGTVSLSDNNVTQTVTTANANYEVLFSVTADNTTRTEGARKNSNLTFNPSTGTLTATKFSGTLSGNASTATTWATARTLTIGFTGKSVNGSDNVSWSLSEIGAAASDHGHWWIDNECSANRFAFLKPAGVTIEHSKNSGSTWTDASYSNEEKINLFTGSTRINVGGYGSSEYATSAYQTRITIDASNVGVYTFIRAFDINISTNGSGGCNVTIQACAVGSTTYNTIINEHGIAGWSGRNFIYINAGNSFTFGTGSGHIRYIRFIFKIKGGETSGNHRGLQILSIRGYGGEGWNTNSQMAYTGHLYSYDSSQNATFPAKITAKEFSGSGASLTSLNASEISSGTLSADRLATSGATAGSYGPSANATPGYGATFNVPYITVDAKGRVTAISTKTVKIPASDNTNTTYSFATGDTNGTFKVTPSGGTATNISIKGLGSAAYTASSAYATSGHTHGLGHSNFTVAIDSTTNTWAAIGVDGTNKYVLKSIRTNTNAPPYLLNDFSAGIVFGGEDTRGVISMKYDTPSIRFAGGNKTATEGGTAKWYITLTGTHNTTYNLGTMHQVTQTATTTSAAYEVLFSGTADNTTRTEGARKNSNLTFNPSTGVLTATKFDGQIVGKKYEDYDPFSTKHDHHPVLFYQDGFGSPSKVGYASMGFTYDSIHGELFSGGMNCGVLNTKIIDMSGTTDDPNSEINYKGTKATHTMIKFVDNAGDTSGNGIVIGGGGLVVVGAGESANNLVSAASLPGGQEKLYLTSDSEIYFYTNCNTIGDRKGMTLNTALSLYPNSNNTGSVGTSSYKWASMYATTFYGALSGNANTASTAKKLKYCTLCNEASDAATYPWYRIAYAYTTNAYSDLNLVMMVTCGFGSKWGIFKARARTEGKAGTFGGTVTIEWIVNDGFTNAQLYLLTKNNYQVDTAKSGTATAEIWFKSDGRYWGYTFTVLHEGWRTGTASDLWALSSYSKNGSENYNKNASGVKSATSSKIYSTNTPGSSSHAGYSIPFFSGPIDSSSPEKNDTAASGNKTILHNGEFRLGLLEGTTSTDGYAQLVLGNGIASGTAGNKYGKISLYSSSAYAVQIIPANLTGTRTLTLPNTSGTVALTSHTHSYIPKSSAATLFSGTAAASITMTSMSGYTRLVVFCNNTSNSSYFTVELQCTTGYHYHAMTVSPPPAAQTSNSFYGLLFNLSSNTKLSVSAGKYSNLSSSASLANGPTVHITKVLGYKF